MRRRSLLNLGLLSSGLVSAFSGITLQVKYHMHHAIEDSASVLSHATWSYLHKGSSMLLLVLAAWHLIENWKWLRAVWTSGRLKRHQQLFTMCALFLAATLTGLVAWAVGGFATGFRLEKGIVEIHDKITLLLTVFLVLHTWSRRRRLVV